MTQTYFPFDSGSGANVTEGQWQKMAEHWLKTGVISGILNQLEVYADSTGMQVKVKSGATWIKGHYFESDEEETLAIGSADPTNPRIDRVIVKLDWTNNNIQLTVLQGTPATTPTAPALTQNTSRWEISLAQVSVSAGATTIAAGDVTSERNFAKNANAIQSSWSDAVLENGWTNSTGFYKAQYMKDEFGFVHIRGVVEGGTATAGTAIFTLPSGYRPSARNAYAVRSYDGSNDVGGRVDVRTDGKVTIETGGSGYLTLNVPSFKV